MVSWLPSLAETSAILLHLAWEKDIKTQVLRHHVKSYQGRRILLLIYRRKSHLVLGKSSSCSASCDTHNRFTNAGNANNGSKKPARKVLSNQIETKSTVVIMATKESVYHYQQYSLHGTWDTSSRKMAASLRTSAKSRHCLASLSSWAPFHHAKQILPHILVPSWGKNAWWHLRSVY